MNATTPPDEQPEVAPYVAPEGDEDVRGTGSIYARIARVQGLVRDIKHNKTATIKTKTGGEYSFDYITKGLLEQHARALFAPEGVAVLIDEETIQQDSNRCKVRVAVTLACDDSAVTLHRTGYGNADDDKGPAKAGTTAVRLLLADLLLQGGDDVQEEDSVDYRPHVQGQALQEGDRPATPEQLKYATDLIFRAQLDKAMPDATHALLRLARPIAQSEIGPGLEVVDALRLIPQPVASKLIERLEVYAANPKGAKLVWEKVAEWEGANGYSNGVNPEDTKSRSGEGPPLLDANGQPIPF